MGKVRLWVNDEDYGTMSRESADMYEMAAPPDEVIRTEPVDDDAPVFLSEAKPE